MALEITRDELTAADLRVGATKTKDARGSRRMLAIVLVLEDGGRTCGMDWQTLRDRMHRNNTEWLAVCH